MAEDGSTYEAADTSQFLILCNRGFEALYLQGSPIQLMIPTLQACTEQCAAQGTQCAGATFGTFGGSDLQCYLYSKMLPSDAPSYPIIAAVRTSNEQGPNVRRDIVSNGGFDEGLSPWTSTLTSTGNQFTVLDHAAVVRLASGDSISLSEQVAEPAVGNAAYFFSMDISISARNPLPRWKRQDSTSPVSCQINLQNGLGDTFNGQVLGVADGVRTTYGSGTIQQGGISEIIINVQCSGTSDGVVSLDNIFFYVFLTTGDSNSPCSTGSSILQNGGFDTAFPPWTTSQGSSTSATFSVSGGQAIVAYAAGASPDDDQAQISQSASIPIDTSYKITADLYITVTSQGSCAVNFVNEFESLYNTGQITTSQNLTVDFDGFSDITSSKFAISISCSGPDVNRVGIDTVGLIVNSGQACSS